MTTPLDPPKNASKWACLLRPLGFSAGFVGVMGILYAVGNASYRVPLIGQDRDELERMKTGRHIVFGSSHGYNVDVSDAGFDGVNMSHGGQDVFEQVYMAREVKRVAPKLELVVFTLSYFSFALDNGAEFSQGAQRSGRRVRMYATFPSFRFIRGDATTWVKGMLTPIVTPDHWQRLLWPAETTQEGDVEEEVRRVAKRDERPQGEQALAQHAKSRCRQYAKLMKKMEASHPGLAGDTFAAVRDAAKEFEEAGVRVVLVTTPYHDTYNACFDGKRQKLTRRFAKRIAHETGAEYIDGGQEPQFSSNRDFFRNSDHMNTSGVAAFSRWFARQLADAEKR